MKVKAKQINVQKPGPNKPNLQKPLSKSPKGEALKDIKGGLGVKKPGKKPDVKQDQIKLSPEASEPQAKTKDVKSFMDAWGLN